MQTQYLFFPMKLDNRSLLDIIVELKPMYI